MAFVSEMRLGRLHIGQTWRSLRARGVDQKRGAGVALSRALLFQQLLNDLFRFLVLPYSEMVVSDNSIRIDQIVSGPVFIRKSFPDGVAVIDGYRVGDVQVVYRLPDVSDVFFERKFRRVHTQHGEPAVAVLLEPCPHVRNGSQAIDARVRPEIDEHHAPANIGRSEWRRIEPGARARKGRHGARARRWRGLTLSRAG